MIEIGVVIAVVTGIVEAIKKVGLASRFAPIVSIVLGVAITLGVHGSIAIEHVVTGIIVGLSASGLYSGTKAVIKK